MLGFFARKLTQSSDHLVDWSRTAIYLRNGGRHSYTAQQIIERAFIIATTAASAYLGACLNKPEKTGYSDTSAGIAFGLAGFLFSHVCTMYPLIKKRRQQKAECQVIIQDINNTVKNKGFGDLSFKIHYVIKEIMRTSLSTNESGNATGTWGHRKTMLQNLDKSLDGNDAAVSFFWSDNTTQLIEKLRNPQEDRVLSLSVV
jgi:hypothetical protein